MNASTANEVPLIDVAPLFAGPGPDRDGVDRAVGEAAANSGFFTITAPTEVLPTDAATRTAMLTVFDLPSAEQRRLWRTLYCPEHANVYRGWSPRQGEVAVDIYDLGPDIARAVPPQTGPGNDDPLLGFTPVPSDDVLPGWVGTVARYYRAMEHVGTVLMRSVARILTLPETFFDEAFQGGISTLRVMRYEFPPSDTRTRPAIAPGTETTTDPGAPRRGEHVDSGFVTLLSQHGVGGLSAKMRSGAWVDVPPVDGHVVVNFGGLLERWTAGRFLATPHRVESEATTRYSIPFFYEPRADAVIRPLPIAGSPQFEPFAYGDHLWSAMSKFPNFTAIADLRTPRGIAQPVTG